MRTNHVLLYCPEILLALLLLISAKLMNDGLLLHTLRIDSGGGKPNSGGY